MSHSTRFPWCSGLRIPNKTAPCEILWCTPVFREDCWGTYCVLGVELLGEAVRLNWGAPPQECHLLGQFLQRMNEGLPWIVEAAAPLLAQWRWAVGRIALMTDSHIVFGTIG